MILLPPECGSIRAWNTLLLWPLLKVSLLVPAGKGVGLFGVAFHVLLVGGQRATMPCGARGGNSRGTT